MDNLKQLATKLEGKLASKEGFKEIHGGGFLGGKAKKSFATWSEAEKKSVLPQYLVQDFLHQGEDLESYYGIYAFSTKGEIDAETLAQLMQEASGIDISTVRYESLSYSCLELWRGPEGSSAHEENTISTALSDVANGLFVYTEAVGWDNHALLDKPLVIYAHCKGGDYIYPIKKTILSKI